MSEVEFPQILLFMRKTFFFPSPCRGKTQNINLLFRSLHKLCSTLRNVDFRNDDFHIFSFTLDKKVEKSTFHLKKLVINVHIHSLLLLRFRFD